MQINEIFYSVQGEIDVGKPVVFIRFSGCNLIREERGCKFCDTIYAEQGKAMSKEEIINEVRKYKCEDVVITGGEPCFQKEDLLSLIVSLNDLDYNIYVETNGTIYDTDIFWYCREVNCSPKKQAIDIKVLEQLNINNNVRFKFVYEDESDKWWEEIIEKLNIEAQDVYIMPEGKNRQEQLDKMEQVVEYCKEKGYNFTPRLHILIWGNKQGV